MTSRIALLMVLLASLTAALFGWQSWQNQNRTYTLSVATGAKDGDYHAFASQLAQLVERYNPRIKLVVLESAGSVENFEWLERNRAQLAIVQSGTPVKPNARTLAPLFPEVAHLIARRGANIRSFADLLGKRVALMPIGSGSYSLFQAIKTHFKLDETNFTALPMKSKDAYAALLAGQVDAVFRVIARGNPATAKLLASGRADLVPIDQAESLRLNLPYLEATLFPKGTYDGSQPIPPSNIPAIGVRATLLARSDVPDTVAQALVQTLFDHRSELIEAYPRAAQVALPSAQDSIGLPYHPGARAYFDQKQPGFLERYTDQIGLLFSLGLAAISGLLQLRTWFLNRRKNRADEYNLELLGLISMLESSRTPAQLEAGRVQLLAVLRRVVGALDTDEITPEGFQSFSFTWDAAMAQLRHQETLLQQRSGG